MPKLAGLYAVTDEHLIPEEKFKQAVEAALQGGAKIIQYRDKSDDENKRFQQADILCDLCRQYKAISIINDDIALTKAVNADGIHLGRDDISITEARRSLGKEAIIGISCYNDLQLASDAEKHTASYVAFGAMFSSPTKPGAITSDPHIITAAKQQLSIPVCAIGGITEQNIQQLVQQGADMTAVISSLFSSKDIKGSADTLSQYFC